jgi:hypothetical protein
MEWTNPRVLEIPGEPRKDASTSELTIAKEVKRVVIGL